jgi:tetratricopeptide (TPR) repeat protein
MARDLDPVKVETGPAGVGFRPLMPTRPPRPRPLRRACAAWAVLLVVSTTGWTPAGLAWGGRFAQAQNRPSVAVVGVHGGGPQTPEELRSLGKDVADGFRIAARYDVVDSAGLRERFLPARAQLVDAVFLGPATAALQEGRVQYESARFDAAVEAFRRAESALAGNLEFARDQRLLVDIQLYLGLAYASMGAREDAREAFGEVVRLAPDRVLDTLQYPPKIVSLFDEARAEILARPGASLRITAPPETRVYVDGRRVGEGDVLVPDLPPGFHVLLAEKDGVGRQFLELRLDEGQERAVAVALQDVGLARVGEQRFETSRSGLTRRLYEEIARVAGTDLVAIAAFDEDGNLQLALYSARSDTMSKGVSASLQAAPDARTAYVKQLVERVALYADDSGAIKPDRVAVELPSLRIGENPVLNDLVFGAPPVVVAAVTPAVEAPTEDPARVRRDRKPVKPGAVIGVILGLLGAGGAATGIYFAVRPAPAPVGTLQITIP